jgi:hypothetical protein
MNKLLIIIPIVVVLLIISSVAAYFLTVKEELVEEEKEAVENKEKFFGQYVRLEQNVEPFCLNILWIKVYTIDSDGQEILVSKNKPATSRSVYKGDNKNFGTQNIHLYEIQDDIDHNGLYHSECGVGEQEWIEIDLEQEYPISRIQIGNRLDCCQERILNSKIVVLDAQKTETWGESITETKDEYEFYIE